MSFEVFLVFRKMPACAKRRIPFRIFEIFDVAQIFAPVVNKRIRAFDGEMAEIPEFMDKRHQNPQECKKSYIL